jgi:acyl-CoA reductase-like NAD-dependent aldehyde dehydrogenase
LYGLLPEDSLNAVDVPFGGSSYGSREQGFAAVEFYTQIKTVYLSA